MKQTPNIVAARRMAESAHEGQIDRDGIEHFEHCARVAQRVADESGTESAIIVAYLHDTLEDTTLIYGDIEQQFGGEIADAVLAMTHLHNETYEQFTERACKNQIARQVKIADILDNLGRKDAKLFRKHDVYMWALNHLRSVA